jgi:hypothetical protein
VEIVQILHERMKPADAVLFSPEKLLPNQIDYEGRNEGLPAVDRFYVNSDDTKHRLDDWFRVRFLTRADVPGALARYPRIWFLNEMHPKLLKPSAKPVGPIIAEGLRKEYRQVDRWQVADYEILLYERIR